MKKTLLVLNVIVVFIYVLMSSFSSGPASNGYNCTGAETGLQNPNGCQSCHGNFSTSGISVSIVMDSSGFPVSEYVPGTTYTIKIKGTNNTNNTLPKFGFQLSCIKGSTAVTTPINAGIWKSPFPSGTKLSLASPGNYVTNIVEHSSPSTVTSGNGGNGSIYEKSILWTAPGAGTGTVSFWGMMNIVDGNGGSGATDKWNGGKLVVQERLSTGIEAHIRNSDLQIYPNPATDFFTINLSGTSAGTYLVKAYDINGRIAFNQNINISDLNNSSTINTSDWKAGYYTVFVSGENYNRALSVIKY